MNPSTHIPDPTLTVPVLSDQSKSVVALDQVRAAARFGTLGFDAYVAAVLVESNRLFNVRGAN